MATLFFPAEKPELIHRRYHAEKRKDKTPMEILTGKEQKEDWIVLLQEKIRKKEFSLSA